MGDLDLFVIDVFMDFDFELEAESFLLMSFKVAFKLLANSVDPKEPLSKGHLKVIFLTPGREMSMLKPSLWARVLKFGRSVRIGVFMVLFL
jgi:hypothetical protein